MVGREAVPVAVDPLRLMREFVERCHGDRRHVEHVRLLALQLFDQLAETLERGSRVSGRSWRPPSLLHDVGQMVSYRKHHRHSFQLIMHAERLNLDPRQRLLVALISRYHRRRGPPRSTRSSPAWSRPTRPSCAGCRAFSGSPTGSTGAIRPPWRASRPRLPSLRLVVTAIPRLAGADLSLESHRPRAFRCARQVPR